MNYLGLMCIAIAVYFHACMVSDAIRSHRDAVSHHAKMDSIAADNIANAVRHHAVMCR